MLRSGETVDLDQRYYPGQEKARLGACARGAGGGWILKEDAFFAIDSEGRAGAVHKDTPELKNAPRYHVVARNDKLRDATTWVHVLNDRNGRPVYVHKHALNKVHRTPSGALVVEGISDIKPVCLGVSGWDFTRNVCEVVAHSLGHLYLPKAIKNYERFLTRGALRAFADAAFAELRGRSSPGIALLRTRTELADALAPKVEMVFANGLVRTGLLRNFDLWVPEAKSLLQQQVGLPEPKNKDKQARCLWASASYRQWLQEWAEQRTAETAPAENQSTEQPEALAA
jgi:hypothetical protein